MKKREFDVGECSHSTIENRSSEGVHNDPILEPKHKIFLSHSGAQKEFVEHLCKALEDRCHYPFFDRHPQSLPKGEQFPGLIVKAAQQCQLLVVVVSEEYFMSKWPMIELNAFVQASKVLKSNINVKILPLFYGLSVNDLKDEKRQQRWFEKWETFVRDDGRTKVEDWKYALDELTKFNGLSYDREFKPIVSYENEIVSHICKIVLPNIKWDDSHVQGNAHEVILEKMKEIGLSPRYKVKVVGIYGVGGIGKTTICKKLFNELSNEYEGRVCHLEFNIKGSNSKEFLQKASIELARKEVEVVQPLGEGECINILKENLFKQRTLLALDNIWNNDCSIKQALLFLNMGFHKESFVIVTARSQSTLECLGINGSSCLEMPELRGVEATKLFLHYATKEKQFATSDMIYINMCIAKCFFSKGDGRGFHFHPLALEVLGRQLSLLGEIPFEWVQKLEEGLEVHVVHDVLKIGFDLLHPREQALFIDVAFFSSPNCLTWSWDKLNAFHLNDEMFNEHLIGWREHLSILHKQNDRDIQSRLDSFTSKGFLQDSDLSSGRIGIHELYIEFAKLEAKGKIGEAKDMWNRSWVYVDADDGDILELEATPAGGCWSKLTRLYIQLNTSLDGIEWQYFSNVLMLHLDGKDSVQGTLNLKGMKCLRSLKLQGFKVLESLEGFSGLKNLTIFEWTTNLSSLDETRKTYFVGHFPATLKFLSISNKCVVLEPNVLAQCNMLCNLLLNGVDVGELLDLSNCSSLDSVNLYFSNIQQTMLVLCTSKASKLKFLDVRWPEHLEFIDGAVAIQGLDQVVGLEHLHLCGCSFAGLPSLLTLTKLRSLKLVGLGRFPELFIPHQIQELHYLILGSIKTPFLSGFKQLQILDLSGSFSLTRLPRMDDLLALRTLDLRYCWCLEQLPDLSKSRSLEELILDCCNGLKLHEKDIQMLATLPSLHPVRFSNLTGIVRLDFIRRKVLRHQGPSYFVPDSWLVWKEGGWEEKELGQPPIGIFH